VWAKKLGTEGEQFKLEASEDSMMKSQVFCLIDLTSVELGHQSDQSLWFMKCSKCDRESENGMSILHPQAGFQYVCLACQVATTPEITDLGVAERVMEEATQLKLELESLMKKLGAAGQPVVPPGLEAFVATPAKILESVNAFFENARKDRDHILAALTEEQKLQQALKVAVEREDFEEASRIKQQLKELGPAESTG
jgi:hypothetical protein